MLILAVNTVSRGILQGVKKNNCAGASTVLNDGDARISSSDAMKDNLRARRLRGRGGELAKLSVVLARFDGSRTSTPSN